MRKTAAQLDREVTEILANPAITDEQIKAINPEMAATWIVGMMPMSDAQRRVLAIACRNGGHVTAGTDEHRGHTGHPIPASALLALIRRGYLVHGYGSDSGLAGHLSQSARERLATGGVSQNVRAPTKTPKDVGAWLANALPIWRQRIGQESKDLDLSDPDDRAALRGRLALACRSIKTSDVRTLATALGAESVPLSHDGAVLALANAWIKGAR